MIIFLIGMMGSGKTTLGRKIAEALQDPFVDLDLYLEERAGRTIAELFEQEGQERFRELEREALKAVVQQYGHAVVSTGGGTPCFFDNIGFMNQHGKTFFLDVPVEELLKRLSGYELAVRPLLAGKSRREIKSFLVETLSHRRQFYERAGATLQGASITLEQFQLIFNNN